MTDEHAFTVAGGPLVARGPRAFHVETGDPAAMKAYFGNETQARRAQDAPWRPLGEIRREEMHRLLDEWINAMGSA